MMSVEMLERRKALPKRGKNARLDVEVHERAKAMFGYGQALESLEMEQLKSKETADLFAACKDCNIDNPFTTESVEKYKDVTVKAAKKKYSNRNSWDYTTTNKFTWERKALDQSQKNAYNGQVPEFVLQTACDLKEKMPHLEFYIEELVRTTTRKRNSLDPFLLVKDAAGQWYYLEVWNEPGYKQERMV